MWQSGASLVAVRRLSLRWLLLLWSTGSVLLVHRLSCLATKCGNFPCPLCWQVNSSPLDQCNSGRSQARPHWNKGRRKSVIPNRGSCHPDLTTEEAKWRDPPPSRWKEVLRTVRNYRFELFLTHLCLWAITPCTNKASVTSLKRAACEQRKDKTVTAS